MLIGLGWWFCWFGFACCLGCLWCLLARSWVGWSSAFWVCVFPVLLVVGLGNVIMVLVNSVADFVSLCCLGFILVVGLLGF